MSWSDGIMMSQAQIAPSSEPVRRQKRHLVRRAKLVDIAWSVRQMEAFAATIPTRVKIYPGFDIGCDIMAKMITDHYILISESGGKRSGIIGAFKCHHPFNPHVRVLSEAFWWVPDAYRLTRVGYLLLREYTRYGRADFDIVTLTLEAASNVSDKSLQKLGYKQFERNFSLEV